MLGAFGAIRSAHPRAPKSVGADGKKRAERLRAAAMPNFQSSSAIVPHARANVCISAPQLF